MIFSEAFFTPSNYIGSGFVICVYQGEQPSIEDYIANYATSYNFASSNILKLIVKSGEFSTITNTIETDPDGQYYTQAIKSFRSGTATWASIQNAYDASNMPLVAQVNQEGYYFLSDNELEEFQWGINFAMGLIPPGDGNSPPPLTLTIVPVSDLTSNGVIKFRSTEFEHPNISDEDRAIDMSIIGSRS
jgi:hypothetical protein